MTMISLLSSCAGQRHLNQLVKHTCVLPHMRHGLADCLGASAVELESNADATRMAGLYVVIGTVPKLQDEAVLLPARR